MPNSTLPAAASRSEQASSALLSPVALWCYGLSIVLLVLGLLSIATGVSQISSGQVLRILAHTWGPDSLAQLISVDWRNSQATIITELRTPRLLLAILAGAGLAVTGAALQAATRNPLTDPFLLGVSSGASMGAVLVISHTGMILGLYTIPLFSFAGALISFVLLLVLLRRPQNQRPDRLVLAGVAISFLLMAATNALIFMGDQRAAQSVVFWMLGGLGRGTWELLLIPTLVISLGIALLFAQARNLNALMMGQESATALGVDVARIRIVVLLLATLVTSLIVSLTGTIGFIGHCGLGYCFDIGITSENKAHPNEKRPYQLSDKAFLLTALIFR